MYRSRFVRELQRQHAQELARRDEMIQSLLDRIQHPERVPIWREPPPPVEEEDGPFQFLIPDPDQLPA